VGRHRGTLALGLLLLSCWQICETLVPVAIGLAIDHAVIPLDIVALAVSVLGILALFVMLSYSYRFGARCFQRVREQEAHALRVEVAESGLHSSRDDRAAGEVLSLASADADVASEVFFHIGRGGAGIIGLAAAAAYLLAADPLTGLVVAIGVSLSLAVVALPSRAITRRSAVQQEAIGAAGSGASDLMHGLGVLKSIGGERWAATRYRRLSRTAADAGVATGSRTGVLEGLGALTMMLVLAAVVLTAGLRVAEGSMGIGTFVAVLGVAAFFTEPMQTIAQVVGALARSRGAADRIAAYLDGARNADAGDCAGDATFRAPAPGPARVEGGAVYVEGLALDDGSSLDFHAASGTLTAVVAERPATADTVVAALAAACDGVSSIAAPHHVDLFEGTIRSNIALDHDESAAVAKEAIDASAARELVELVPDGLEHRIDDLGRNLSGGQRQRIALARALHADPEVLVLHDPSTAVDAVTEAAVADSITELRRGRCTLVVTTSPAYLSAADAVVFVREAAPAVMGTHVELAERSARYREAVSR